MKRYGLKKWVYALLPIGISAILFPLLIDTRPYIVPFTSQQQALPTVTVFVTNHGWHTGIVVPATALQQQLPELAMRFPDYQFLEIGWGDAGFYQSETITVELTLKAILMPSDAVMHVVGFDGLPQKMFYQSDTKTLAITDEQFQNLLTFIRHSFALTTQGKLQPQQFGRYGDSQFYRAIGQYHAFNTCNKWTAKALASAGIKLSTSYKLTASSVTNAL